MRVLILVIVISLLFILKSFGQISIGGTPQDIVLLKSAKVPVVEMPLINNRNLQISAAIQNVDEYKLKQLKFAHAFTVNFTPQNSGEWYNTVNGLNCWKLKIHSKGAKSLNLIFDQFELPPNSKLFIYNEKEDYVLGAFTVENNKASGKFAVSPVIGDEITIHYEVSEADKNKIPFAVNKINHDFIGILEKSDRNPLGIRSGDCNIDVNCELGEEWNEVKDAVCRIIVDGVEICSGTLINNTQNTKDDLKPYILSAAHCYDKWEYAQTSVFTFNYESPYCAPLDGDPSNSISGALMKAQFDSLDFALVELSVKPPPDFRPYYVGWDKSTNLPDSSVSIHHPQGGIKKIAFDEDAPEISDFSSKYVENGFYKILRWDQGVTEIGSSGGGLFNEDKNLIGTLTGGVASCSNPVRDYFERFALSWDYKNDSSKQLKYWLDPTKSNVENLEGEKFYEDEEVCGAFTNLKDNDTHQMISIQESNEFSGYWGGTNSVGISEFVEQFSIYGNEQLFGISLGIGKIHLASDESNSQITINVYDGNELPENLIYSKNVLVKELIDDAMNFIGFDETIYPEDTFFVGFELSNMEPQDSLVVYQSLRPTNTDNHFYYKQNDTWQNFKETNLGGNSMVNVFELVACNIEDSINNTPPHPPEIDEIFVYPNPTQTEFSIISESELKQEKIAVINLIGQRVEAKISIADRYKANINLAGNVPGVYFVFVETERGIFSRKVSYIPW